MKIDEVLKVTDVLVMHIKETDRRIAVAVETLEWYANPAHGGTGRAQAALEQIRTEQRIRGERRVMDTWTMQMIAMDSSRSGKDRRQNAQ